MSPRYSYLQRFKRWAVKRRLRQYRWCSFLLLCAKRLYSLRVSPKKTPKNKRKADSAYTFIWDPKINNVPDEGANVFHFQCLSILWTGKNKDGKTNNNASLVLSWRRAKRRLLHISWDRHQNKVDASLDGKPLPLATPRQQGEGGR